jgi:methionyl aminopeptidase
VYTKVKTLDEIQSMRESGRMLAAVLRALQDYVQPEQSTKEVADYAAKELKTLGGKPSFLGYHGFPDVICISVNDEVVHGIPRKDKIIHEGDLVGLDFGVTYKGMITDAAVTITAGSSKDPAHRKLLEVTKESLHAGIKRVKDGVQTEDIGEAIQAVLDTHGYGIVRDLVGHGVGHHVHEEPNVPNYGRKGHGERLQAGMTIAIEPMATLGGYEVGIDADQWTIRTLDRSLAAHFEHTVLITENGAEILTKL